ncbi:MAG TPA: hypothetical protein VNZ52_06115 [Candidatus Thermoplasmatota archaeon]|nr:hypothetical protein [Candidatus Thermoplasmatota archaeon]
MQAQVALYRYRCACPGCAYTRESAEAPTWVGFSLRADGALLCSECGGNDAGHDHTYATPMGTRLFVGGDVI